MAFWKNTHTNQRVYPQSDQYYTTNNNKKTVLAWVAAFGSLVVIVGLFLGLFFGGRWAYRQLKDDTTNTTVATSENVLSSDSELAESTGDNNVSVAPDESTNSETINEQNSSEPNNAHSEPRISNDSTDTPGISADNAMPNTGITLHTLVFLFGFVTVVSTMFFANRQKT